MKDNKGLSLVELVVAVSILAIVSAILLNFVVVGNNVYRNVSADVSLQMQSQTALAQIREYTVDAYQTVNIVNPTVNTTDTMTIDAGIISPYKMYIFKYYPASTPNGTDGRLTIEERELFDDGTTPATTTGEMEICEGVAEFCVKRTSALGETGVTLNSALEITLTLTKNGKNYTGIEVVGLRNQPVVNGGV
ncbi:prepilin-type N-terminal cleavage/methylation domain-containing protein [Lachnospiraceae bacterium ZAX-1]